jgi:penicillin-binding protein 2
MNNAKIAVAVCVENAGYGGRFAGPIASLIVEKYLNDTISTKRLSLETKMKEADLIHKYFPKAIQKDSLVNE